MNDIVPEKRFYRLTIHGLSVADAMDLVSRYSQTRNADAYRGFHPGTLEFDSYKWATGSPLEFMFRSRKSAGITLSSQNEEAGEEFAQMPFCALPEGKWEEIEPT